MNTNIIMSNALIIMRNQWKKLIYYSVLRR